nr:hypothetical protein [Tessaracoccus coleopterorum]
MPRIGEVGDVAQCFWVFESGVEETYGHGGVGLAGQVERDERILSAGEGQVAVVLVEVGSDPVDQGCGGVGLSAESGEVAQVKAGIS